MAAVAGMGLALGSFALRRGAFETQGGLPVYGAGVLLAAGASMGGFVALRRGMALGSGAFVGLLFGLFLARVALVGLFGLAVYVFAPAHLATGLLPLVGFHFIFAVIEIALLTRSGPVGRGRSEKARGRG